MSDTLSLDRRAEKAILDGLETVLPPDRLAHYQSNVWSLSSDGGHSAKVKLGNSIFLASRFGKNFSVENQPALRQAYANAAWGGESGDTEEAFAARARVEAQQMRDERQLLLGPDSGDDEAAAVARAGSLHGLVMESALSGKPYTEAVRNWQATAAGKPGFQQAQLSAYDAAARGIHDAVTARMQELKPVVDQVEAGLRQEKEIAGAYGGESLIEAIRSLPPQDRPLALSMLSRRVAPTGEAKEKGGQFMQSFGRGLSGILVGTARTSEASMLDSAEEKLAGLKAGDTFGGRFNDFWSYLSGKSAAGMEQRALKLLAEPVLSDKTITEQDIAAARERIATERDRLAISMQLEAIAKGQLDPIKGSGFWTEKVWYPFAESVAPQVALFALTRKIAPSGAVFSGAGKLAAVGNMAASGAGSVPLMFGMMADQNAQQLMALNPGMKVEDAFRVGRNASYLQTGLEYAQTMLGVGVLGKAKGLGQQLLKMQGSAWKTLGGSLAAGAASQNAIEAIQDITPPIVQALTDDAPDVPWSKFFNGSNGEGGYWTQRADTFFALLPLVVVGAGGQTIRNKSTETELQRMAGSMTDVHLHAAGIPAETRTAILAETDPVRRLDAFSAALPNADKATAAEGVARLEAEQARAGTLTEELNRANITISTVPDGRGNGVFKVRTAEGETQHATHTDALSFARAHLLANGEAESAPLLDMLEALDANPLRPVTSSETTLVPEQKVSAFLDERLAILQDDTAAPEARQRAERESAAMVARLKVYEEANPDAEIDPRKLAVGGQSELQVREGVATAVAKVALGQSPYTVLEEHTEADAEAYLQTGEATVEGLAGMIRQVEAATGDRYLNGWTEGQDTAQDRLAVKEAFSELAQVHATGKGRAGKAAGSRVAAVARADRRDAQRRVKAAATDGAFPAGLMARLKAHVEWLKAVVGKAIRLHRARKEAGGSFDIDAFLNRSVGLEPDAAHAAGVVEQAQLIYTPPTPEEEANGIAFSLDNGTIKQSPEAAKMWADLSAKYSERVRQLISNLPKSEALALRGVEFIFSRRQDSDAVDAKARITALRDGEPFGHVELTGQDLRELISGGIQPTGIANDFVNAVRHSIRPDLMGNITEWTLGMDAVYRYRLKYRDISPGTSPKDSTPISHNEFTTTRPLTFDELAKYEAQPLAAPAPSSGASFRLTPAQDAEYLAAVEAGDMDTAQRMVDEAARAAGYNRKGVRAGFYVKGVPLPPSRDRINFGPGYYVAEDAELDATSPESLSVSPKLNTRDLERLGIKPEDVEFRREVVYVKAAKPIRSEYGGNFDKATADFINAQLAYDSAVQDAYRRVGADFEGTSWGKTVADLIAAGRLDFDSRQGTTGRKGMSSELVVQRPSQIKSAAPVTRDESGNVIPLSQRFNPESDSISYRITPSATLDALSSQLAKRSRDPEARRKILDAARESLAKLKRDWSTMRQTWRGDTIRAKVEKRTPKELDKEQAMRQALRQAELESEVEQRHQGTLDAMAEGLAEFDSAVHPVLSRITTRQRIKWTDKNGKERSALHVVGDILPRSQAALSGLAEYDDAAGLPPFLFRGTRAPDQVAQELEAAGIGDGSVSMLWEMLRKEIDSVRAMREAVAVMSTDMKNARNQAKEELAEWRREQDEMQAEDWSGRAVLVRNLRILDALYASFPPEVRAKSGGWVNMARLKTEKAMAAELERRLLIADAHLEEVLRKDSLAEIQALFRKARPDRTPGEKPRGKLGAAVHRFFDEAERVAAMTPDELEVARPKPEDYERDGITPEEAANLWEREQILDQFGALNAKVDGKPFRDAAHLARALDLLEDVYTTGRNRWRTIEEARLEEVRALTGAAIEALGGVSRAALQRRKAKNTKPLSLLSLKSALSFTQVMEEIFGRGHALAKRWSTAVRNGDAARTDEIIATRRRFTEAAMKATGHRGRLMRQALFDMGDPARQTVSVSLQPTRTESVSVPVDTFGDILTSAADAAALGLSAADVDALREQFDALDPNSQTQNLTLKREQKGTPELSTFTEAEGVFLTMLWRQEQYQPALTADGFDTAAIEEIEGQLSPAAVKLREFLTAEYAAGYAPLAKVFERMFGVSLPQIENYAPGAFYNSGSSESGLDVTGSGVVEGGFRAGFLKDRKRHKAAPKAENAFATFFGHLNQTAHWKAHAETFRELRAVFGNPKVKMALEAAHGIDGVRAVQDWLTALEGNGFKQAGGKLLSMVYSIQSYKALAWKLGTLMKQSTALLGAAYRMPLADYARGLGRLFTGQLEYAAMWNSPLIRRRVEAGFSPEARAVLAQTWSAKPTRRMEFLNRGMELIGEVDAMFTAGSAAIAYDYHYRKAKADGMTDEVAASVAEQEAADVVSRTAQPVEVSAKSLLELRMDTNPLGRVAFQFASEARQKSALWLLAWRNTLTGKATADDARVLVILHLVVGPLIAGISAAWRDVRDDDDDELFDQQNWKTKDFLAAAAFGPLSGIPLVRDVVDGFESPDGGPISDYVKAGKAGVALVKGPEDSEKERLEWYEKKIVQTLNGLGAFPGVAANIFDQAFRIGNNIINDQVETAEQKKARERREKREAKQ